MTARVSLVPGKTRGHRPAYRLLSDDMSVIPFVFADTLDEFRIWKQIERYVDRPGFRISLGIVNRDFDSHMAEIRPAETFSNVQGVTVRMAGIIEPALIIEAGRFGNKCI